MHVKKSSTIIICLLALCNGVHSQYAGGAGFGSAHAKVFAHSLFGTSFEAIYEGGSGYGISSSSVSITLDGEDPGQLFSGGAGHGDFLHGLGFHILLEGQTESSYTGGVGRGDTLYTTLAVDLQGDPGSGAFAGGVGRGDVFGMNVALTFNDGFSSAIAMGSAGRGDNQGESYRLALSGQALLIISFGGPGRGDDVSLSIHEILRCVNYSVWTGLASTAWEDPANWQCNELPNRYSDVFIPGAVAHFPHITVSPVDIRNLHLEANAQLWVQGALLSVLGGPQ